MVDGHRFSACHRASKRNNSRGRSINRASVRCGDIDAPVPRVRADRRKTRRYGPHNRGYEPSTTVFNRSNAEERCHERYDNHGNPTAPTATAATTT